MTVALLEHNGFAVEVPKQDCCGLPLQSNGLFDDARGYVRRLAPSSRPYARDGRRHRRRLDELHADAQARGAGDPRDRGRRRPARRLRAHVRHLRVPARPCTSAASCKTDFAPSRDGHLPRAVPAAGPRDRQAGARPARADPGAATSSRSTRDCCGVAGTYGLKKEKYDIAMDVGARAVRADRATPAPDLVGVRLRDLPLAHRARHGRRSGAPGGDAPPRLRASWRAARVVGLVIVSHSAAARRGRGRAGARDGRRGRRARGRRRDGRRRRSAPTRAA